MYADVCRQMSWIPNLWAFSKRCLSQEQVPSEWRLARRVGGGGATRQQKQMVGTIVTLCKWLTCSVGGRSLCPPPADSFISFSSQTLKAEWNQAGLGSSYFLTPCRSCPPPSEAPRPVALIYSPLCCSPVTAPPDAAVRALVSAAPSLLGGDPRLYHPDALPPL